MLLKAMAHAVREITVTTLRRLATVLAFGLAAPLLAAKCGDADTPNLSSGEVSDSTYQAIDYKITSDNYNRWVKAQSALDSVGFPDVARVRVRNATEADIERVVKSLEDEPKTRSAIESADISVRDFVLTTIALAQSWDAVNQPARTISGLPPENVAFLRTRATEDPVARERPRAQFLDDDSDSDSEADSDKRGKGKGKAKGKGRGKGRGSDSDS